MGTKHTPGPWRLISEVRNRAYLNMPPHSYERTCQDCGYIAGPEGDSHFVADIITSASPGGRDNAQLIASAPELLDALERAELNITQTRLAADIGRKSAKDKVNWYVGQMNQLSYELRAAIAKAKGE